jgi:hypothetical protein
MQTLERHIKADLWRMFGSQDTPAEWDGLNYGGGKLSQRYWEYLKAVELLDLGPDSVVLDIGGGSRKTGMGFFATLIHRYVKKVIIVDPSIDEYQKAPDNVVFIREYIGPVELKKILNTNINISHIVSLSVLEHIPDDLRPGMIKAINDCFNGQVFVATFEYHAKKCFFDDQLTAKTISNTFKPFTNFYLSRFESSPVWCENAFNPADDTPRWYPLAVKFEQFN